MTSILLPYLFYVMLPIVIGLELRTLKDFNGKRRIKKHPLEFRLAKSAEEKQTPKEYKDSKVFVAIENRFLSRKVRITYWDPPMLLCRSSLDLWNSELFKLIIMVTGYTSIRSPPGESTKRFY